ncbi:MAG: glycosyltransferase family protein [Bacteroidota bacterium]
MSKKVLYAVQATGNGHLSRCMEFYPALSKHADVDVLLSGIQGDLELPFPVKYKRHGLSFVFGKNGGIDYLRTALSLKPLRFIRDVWGIDLKPYDLVVNDFEPITAWACRFARKDCVALSHQAAFLSKKTPRPSHKNWFAEFVFKHFAPANRKVGLHFASYDDFIFTPIVRSEIRSLVTAYDPAEAVVYLPAYDHTVLIEQLLPITKVRWSIFSKHATAISTVGSITVYPIGRERWIDKLKLAQYAIVGGGFEGSSEMLFLKKKVMVLPMSDQYEQLCNAEALRQMGVHIVRAIDENFTNRVRRWVDEATVIDVNFPRQSDEIIAEVLRV